MKTEDKIVYVVPGVSISGGVAVIFQHANRLTERGYDVRIVNFGEDKDVQWFNVKCPIVHWDIFGGKKYPLIDTTIAIATHFSTADIVYNKIPSKRKIYFVQSDERRFGLSQVDFHICHESYQLDMEYMTEAKWIQRWLKEEFAHSAYYVPNGLDEKLFYEVDNLRTENKKRKRVLIEGPIDVPFKGMDDAYNAVKDLDCELWIVSSNGKPKKGWRYDRFFEDVPMEEMKTIYSSCDVFLKMSRIEGFFGPPLEAMACGCAVVVGKCTGHDEYIAHGKNALVVGQGNVAGAQEAVKQLLSDESLRNALIKNGHKTAKEWSWDRSIDFLEKVIKNDDVDVVYTGTSPEHYDYVGIISKIRADLKKKNYIQYSVLSHNNTFLSKKVALFAMRRKSGLYKMCCFLRRFVVLLYNGVIFAYSHPMKFLQKRINSFKRKS